MGRAIEIGAMEINGQDSCPLSKWFSVSAGVVLSITGIAKIWSGLGQARFLAVADPLIGIQFRHLMLAVGVAEIVIVLVCLFSKRKTLALSLVAWLSTT